MIKNKLILLRYILIHIFFVLIYFFIVYYYQIDPLNNNHKNVDLISILSFIIILPFLEELIFRYPLIYNKRNIIIIPIILFFSFHVFLNIKYWLVSVLCILYIFSLIYQLRKEKNYLIVCLLSNIVFSIFHIINFENGHEIIFSFSICFYLLPQFVLSIILSLIRIKFNFLLCLIYHSSYNLILISFLIY